MKVKNNCKFSVFCFLLLVPMAISCSVPTTQALNEANTGIKSNECLSPLYGDFSYPVEAHDENIAHPGLDMFVLPPSSWQAEGGVPQRLHLNQLSYNFIEPQFARTVGDVTEIWLISTWSAKDEDGFKHTVYIYRTNNKSWHEVPSIIEEVPAEIVHLYLGTDGTVWASASTEIGHAYDYYGHSNDTPFVFGVYNEEKSKFELLDFPQKVPLGPVDFDNDKFWIFEKDGPIYDLNPRSLQITKYIDPRTGELSKSMDLPQNFVSSDEALAFMEDGSFYFLDDTPKYYTPQDITLFHFIPEKNTLEAIPSINRLEGGPPYSNLFVDRSGNLWVSDFGWMDKAGDWYQLIRSPVFISTKVEAMPILWEHPQIVLESSNGLLWFQSTNGMTSLDPQKGEWCWFTTYQSNIVEDSDHNLWMIADGKLYKLALGK